MLAYVQSPSGRDLAPNRFLAGAWTLAVDTTTAEVLGAFEQTGLRSILLKGPTLKEPLYGASPRTYRDTDLLIAPDDLNRAASALSGLGFGLAFDHRDHVVVEPHAQEWSRAQPLRVVDLHWRVPGVQLEPAAAWEILSARTEPFAVAGAEARALDPAGLALSVALHAANSAAGAISPSRDLDLAVERFGFSTWTNAAELAEGLHATDALAGGLRSTPVGEVLAAELGLPAVGSRRVRLTAGGATPGAHALLRISEEQSYADRIRTMRRALFPAPDFMRASIPAARRGRLALILAYVSRASSRAARLPAALRDVRRSRP